MKGLKKQILSTLLTASIAASAVPAFAVQIPEDVAGTRFEEPIQVLSALNIMIGDESGKYRPEDTIIRSEVTKMIIHAMGLEDAAASASGQTKFPDVPTDHWANGYINLATSSGIIIGDDEGKFRPNDSITYAEAMTIMVRALGYEPIAEEKGGFPNGYILTGSSNGLSSNVTGSTHDPITRGNVAYLTVNALETNMMEQTGFGSNPVYEVVDKTLLKDKLKVTKGKGQITAIPSSSINGTSNLSKGQIKIGDNVFDTAYNMNNLLGFNVEYYVKQDRDGSEKVILAMPEKDKNATVKITGDLFDSITTKNSNKAIKYYKTESDKTASYAEISAEATMIYNGKYVAFSDSLLNMSEKAGNVTLLDTDRDGKYDIVFVTEYTNLVVDEVTSSGKVTDKYGAAPLKLDEEVDFRITKGFDEIEVSDLQEYDVLSVAASQDKEVYDIIVTNDKVEGKVTGKNDKGILIEGELYKIAANYTESINIGLEGTFFLDVEGKIAAVDTTGQLSTNYAYLIKAYADTQGDESVNFKLFTKEGEEKTITAAEKIRLNGGSSKPAIEVFESLKSGSSVPAQLITFTQNAEGQLTEINTAVDNTATGNVNENKFTKNYNLTDAVYNEDLQRLGNIKLTKDTVIFDIPEGGDDYAIADISMFEDDQQYNAIVYDRSEDFTAKAIVVTNAQFQTNADASIAVVTDVATGVNADDETTEILNAFVDGEEKSIFAEEAGILVKGEHNDKLEAGDIIQYKTNSDGEIVNIRVLLDISAKDEETTETPAENLETVYGKVVKKFSTSINVTVDDGNVRNFSLPQDITVYSVDTQAKKPVSSADISDIQAFDAEENNRVFIKLYKGIVQEVVIVK